MALLAPSGGLDRTRQRQSVAPAPARSVTTTATSTPAQAAEMVEPGVTGSTTPAIDPIDFLSGALAARALGKLGIGVARGAVERAIPKSVVPRLPFKAPPGMTPTIGEIAEQATRVGGKRGAALVKEGGKGFAEQGFKHTQTVRVTWPDGTVHFDAVRGLNRGHAIARAEANWPDARVEPFHIPLKALDSLSAETLKASLSKLGF